MILRCFFLALGQINDPSFRRVLMLGLGLTIALLIAAGAAFFELVQWMSSDGLGIAWIDEATWVGGLLSWGSLIAFLVLSIFLMVPVASAITSMFLEDVAAAVEAKHYAHLPPATKVSFGDGLRDTVNFMGVLITANIVAVVVYIFFPFAAIFIFWGMNGYLLGREYFILAAMRRLGRKGAVEMQRNHRGTIWLAGVLMAVPLTFPLINLIIPILGAATFTHLFHALNGSRQPV